MTKDYYQLTKPGIVGGNAITVIAGFFLASKGDTDWWLLLATLAGLSLIVASGCVFNNYIDRDIDALMERTKDRTLVKGRVSLRSALVYGALLGASGVALLFFYINLLTVTVAILGFFVYVVVYSMWLKRASVYGTLVGSVAGAVPPVVGYLAVSNDVDWGAGILFLILVFWQMIHSYAIAIYRFDDYMKAKIPVFPVKRGIFATKISMLAYVLVFIVATVPLFLFGYTSRIYLFVIVALGLWWLWLCVKGFTAGDDKQWARNIYRYSIMIMIAFCVLAVL